MSTDAKLRALEEELEALQCADNLLQNYTRLPDVKTAAQKLLLGDILMVEDKSKENNISFQIKFDAITFQLTIQTHQLTVTSFNIGLVDVVTDLQTVSYFEKLKTKAESQLNPTLFLQGMSKWYETKIEYENLVRDLYERLSLANELSSFDGDTLNFKNGVQLSVFLDLKNIPAIDVFFEGHMITHLFTQLSAGSIIEVIHGLMS